MAACTAVKVTESNAAGRDQVRCEKQEHSAKKDHTFHYVGARKGEVERWTDEETKK